MNIINDERQLAALDFLRIVMNALLRCAWFRGDRPNSGFGSCACTEPTQKEAVPMQGGGSKPKMSDNPMRKAHKAPRISFMAEPHQMTEAV